jgi:hypothetical protein
MAGSAGMSFSPRTPDQAGSLSCSFDGEKEEMRAAELARLRKRLPHPA